MMEATEGETLDFYGQEPVEPEGYFSTESPPAVKEMLRHRGIFVNGVRREDVIACDTVMGYAICLVYEPAGTPPFKRDPNGYKGRVATALIWGEVQIGRAAP